METRLSKCVCAIGWPFELQKGKNQFLLTNVHLSFSLGHRNMRGLGLLLLAVASCSTVHSNAGIKAIYISLLRVWYKNRLYLSTQAVSFIELTRSYGLERSYKDLKARVHWSRFVRYELERSTCASNYMPSVQRRV